MYQMNINFYEHIDTSFFTSECSCSPQIESHVFSSPDLIISHAFPLLFEDDGKSAEAKIREQMTSLKLALVGW